MIISSLAQAAADGRVEPVGPMQRHWLVDPALDDHPGAGRALGAVSLDVVPATTPVRVVAGMGESVSVVVDGRERGRVARASDGGSFLVDPGPMAAILLSLHSRGVEPVTEGHHPDLEAMDPFDPLRPGSVEAVADSPAHNPELGFFHMRARMLVEGESRGRRTFTLGLGTFAAGEGCHALHRHAKAAEVFFVWEGAGVHLTGDGAEHAMRAGDLVFVPPGEWHGFRTTVDTDTRAFFGYLGADLRSGAGYEVMHPQTEPSSGAR